MVEKRERSPKIDQMGDVNKFAADKGQGQEHGDDTARKIEQGSSLFFLSVS
jgi:hypothetical protein